MIKTMCYKVMKWLIGQQTLAMETKFNPYYHHKLHIIYMFFSIVCFAFKYHMVNVTIEL
jgi:hypothetical protein